MVNANVKRLKSNQSLAKNFSTTRWCEIIDKGGYKELAEQKGTWFKFRHLSYKRYVLDLRYDLEKHVEQFASAKMSNDAEKMTAISKEVVKDLFLIPKEKRDIPATMAMLTTYVEAVQAQERIHLQKNWYLEIKDKESCESEVKFLCALGKLFHQSHTLKQNSFACSLNPRTACMELGSDRHRLFGPAMQVAER
jgi:hypothetical protein